MMVMSSVMVVTVIQGTCSGLYCDISLTGKDISLTLKVYVHINIVQSVRVVNVAKTNKGSTTTTASRIIVDPWFSLLTMKSAQCYVEECYPKH